MGYIRGAVQNCMGVSWPEACLCELLCTCPRGTLLEPGSLLEYSLKNTNPDVLQDPFSL